MVEDQGSIVWDRKKLNVFRRLYNSTAGDHRDTFFEFEGKTFLKAYAKYLILYLEDELSKDERNTTNAKQSERSN